MASAVPSAGFHQNRLLSFLTPEVQQPLAPLVEQVTRKRREGSILVLLCICLASCSTYFPTTIIIQSAKYKNAKVLRGSARGNVGHDVVFTVNDVDGLSCEGKMLVPFSDAHTEGTIDCNNNRNGHFLANSRKASWLGEGKLDDGSRFFISIAR
ncbi:MAG TPA: hypothetical protein VJ746_14925 [Nitrospira sp.]|nr:hypothetical protein [Nitrospira sp.]